MIVCMCDGSCHGYEGDNGESRRARNRERLYIGKQKNEQKILFEWKRYRFDLLDEPSTNEQQNDCANI